MCRYNSQAGTKQGQVQLISQHFRAHMRTALLADLAWNLHLIVPNIAALYSWVIVDNDFYTFCYNVEVLFVRTNNWTLAMPTKIIAHTHGVGTIQRRGLFRSARARWPVWEQFKGGKNSRKYGGDIYMWRPLPSPGQLITHWIPFSAPHTSLLYLYSTGMCILIRSFLNYFLEGAWNQTGAWRSLPYLLKLRYKEAACIVLLICMYM